MTERNRVIEQEVVDYIVDHTQFHGYPPSVRDIAAYLDKTHTVIHRAIRRLVRDGIIEVSPGVARGIRVKNASRKVGDEFV